MVIKTYIYLRWMIKHITVAQVVHLKDKHVQKFFYDHKLFSCLIAGLINKEPDQYF